MPHSKQSARTWSAPNVALDKPQAEPLPLPLHDATSANGESDWRDLAAAMPAALYRLEMGSGGRGHGRFTYFSPAVEALFEYPAAQACAERLFLRRLIVPEDMAQHAASMRAAGASMVLWEHEFRIRTPSGVKKWIHGRAQPQRQADGSIVWTGVLSDITERKRIEAALRASEETYRSLFETVPQGVVYQDAQGNITSANPAAQRILGLSLDQLMGLTSMDPRWQAVHEDGSDFHGEQHPTVIARASLQPVKDEVMGLHKPEGSMVWVRVTATPLFKAGVLDGVYAIFEDITERVRLTQELRLLAATDDLTGAANRRSFMARLSEEFERQRRHPQRACAVVAIDIDHFKKVNDTWGHAAGDAVLRHLTALMQQVTRQVDVIGRVGGEEFALLLPDTGLDDALVLAERLRAHVASAAMPWGGQGLRVSISAGVSVFAPGDADSQAVLVRADRALYDAKDQGRNRVRSLTAPC